MIRNADMRHFGDEHVKRGEKVLHSLSIYFLSCLGHDLLLSPLAIILGS